MTPEVSIVIVCMNRPDLLFPCLDGIRAHTSVSYETLVVAYLFSEDNLRKLRDLYPWVTIIESNQTRGFSENNNLALRRAAGRYCFVLNDDTLLEGPVIDRLHQLFFKLPATTAAVSPRLLLEDGTVQFAGRCFQTPLEYVLGLSGLVKDKPVQATSLSRTENLSGAAFMIKTELFREIGWFDERYFFSPEDVAVARELSRRGYSVYVDPGIDVIHKWRRSSSPIMAAIRPAAVRGSMIYFFGGKGLRCTLTGVVIFAVYSVKWLAAVLRSRKLEALTFANVAASAFSRKTPKELFIRYRP